MPKRKVLGIITARGGSRRLPGKNVKPLAGKPLIVHTIEEALKSEHIDRLVVSTDDEEIAKVSREHGAEVPFMRPAELSRDETPSLPVLQHAIQYLEEKEDYHPELVVILQPTSPLRKREDIDKAIEKFLDSDYDPVLTVSRAECPPHWMYELRDGRLEPFVKGANKAVRSQDLPELYRSNGAVYVMSRDLIMKESRILSDNMGAVVMPPERSVDIDTELDLRFAEFLIKNEKH